MMTALSLRADLARAAGSIPRHRADWQVFSLCRTWLTAGWSGRSACLADGKCLSFSSFLNAAVIPRALGAGEFALKSVGNVLRATGQGYIGLAHRGRLC